jgi:hypothetical protein
VAEEGSLVEAAPKETGQAFTPIRDGTGVIRAVVVPMGKGTLVVSGRPYFMFNHFLELDLNADLAWALSGEWLGEEESGMLFVRGRGHYKSLFGKIAERGNILPLALSVLILIVLGFWMVIPLFGLVFYEKPRTARPIGDRFIAEIRFLKKYRALDSYLKTYLREIKFKFRDSGDDPKTIAIEKALQDGGSLKYRDLIQSLNYLENKMEHL